MFFLFLLCLKQFEYRFETLYTICWVKSHILTLLYNGYGGNSREKNNQNVLKICLLI